MKKEHLHLLTCPTCGSRFELIANDQPGVLLHRLVCAGNGHTYPVRDGIPRFVDTGNYAESFGFQWKKFSKLQLDSYNGTSFSEERFRLITGWTKNELAGKLVLDAGCGAGRFSEIALKHGAELVAFDLSEAVDASQANPSPAEPLICQASIYELPFSASMFDYVYCIGVVQHTPDPSATIRALCRMVKPGGQIGLWIYERDWKSYIGTLGFKYALRPIFSHLSRSQQYSVCAAMVNLFFPLVAFCKRRGLFGRIIMRLLPVASAHIQSVPLSSEDFKTWVLLDTFDMYSPAYDQPQTYEEVTQLLDRENFINIQRHPHGGIAVTATRRG
ncbi:MAG: methyltransferase domain-containing protein [Anaerolineales bacterium]|nr:methyltransferase domain-containing protein [Anaerolineales bacterium]